MTSSSEDPSQALRMTESASRVEALLPRPFGHGFDYTVPTGMHLQAGDYVSVPFGRQQLVGVVWGAARGDVPAGKCKPITAHHAHWPPLSAAMREFISWSARYNMADLGTVLKMTIPLPKAITEPPVETIYLPAITDASLLTPARRKLIENWPQSEPRTATQLKTHASAALIKSMLNAQQLITQQRNLQPTSTTFTLGNPPALRTEQAQAAAALRARLDSGFSANVLDGVTGSGKTEVYFELIEQCLSKAEGQILVLLPEIALTHQWLARFKQRFGADPVLWHSSVSLAKRKAAWQAITTGAARLVVGARSALYLPYHDLRLILIDEEHEASYKQEDGALYHARDMAVARARQENIPILLVSATPSLETVANIRQGKYHEIRLHDRHGVSGFPTVTLIDLRQDKPERGAFLSPTLRAQLLATLEAGHQSMLFLNRRGYAPLLLCRSCGHRFECAHCSAWMVLHHKPTRLQCHHCDTRMPVPPECPQCHADADQLVPCGPGVERIEEEVRGLFPQARILSLTSDEKDIAHGMQSITRGEVDIIIGTQLVAKGHHFPQLALVGVVDADLGLAGGDLRASERTYQLLHQLAGRAGRAAVAGHVYLQSTMPEHPVLQAMKTDDRDGFIDAEMRAREEAGWPPFGRLAALLLDGPNEQAVMQAARALARAAPQAEGFRVLGPAPAPLSRLRNQYRYRLLLKTTRNASLHHYLHNWLSTTPLPTTVRLKIDIDPYNFV